MGWILTYQSIQGIGSDLGLGTVVLLDLGLLAMLVGFYWKIYRDANTRVGDEGISQPALYGSKKIRWSEVRQIRRVGFGLHVSSERTRIVLTPFAYKEPERFARLVLGQLKAPR
jgi:hypothetical protein